MFFSIAPTIQSNFSNSYQLSPTFIVNTDDGWREQSLNNYRIVYKGYADNALLDTVLDEIVTQREPKLLGNFCAIVVDTTTNVLTIKSDRYRSFPIYVKDNKVTNLLPGGKTMWTDSLISVDSEFHITEDKFDVIGDIDTSIISWNDAINTVDNILLTKVKNFVSTNTLPIKIHLSGGVDSLLVYSYFKRVTDNIEIVKCQHIDYNKFWLLNFSTVQKNYWGYKQIHHWNSPTILPSGAPGDEFMLRSPVTMHRYARANNIDVINILETTDCLHSDYFKRYLTVFSGTEPAIADTRELIRSICNTIVNDWQHWHLGNTLTYTPLRDLEITKVMLRLSREDVIQQMFDSKFSIELINRCEPTLSRLISNKKNTGNYMSNLVEFLFNE